jgi:WD40 repeat protein
MLTIAAELRALYCEVTGAAQARPQPTRLGEVADVLNNRGASLVDLGRAAEAVGVFRKAVEADPHHLEASYNLALLDWRHALIDDEEAVARLESAASAQPESSQGQLLCAWIHYERADREQVRACLARALGKEAPTAPAPKRISELCDRASAGYQVDELRPLPSVARALAISRDELVAASAHDDGVRVWWLPSPHELQGCALGARLLALSPEAHVAVAADETTVACWRPRGAREHVLALGPVRALTTCGEELAVVAVADRCVLIDAEDGAHRDIPGRFGTVADLATSADGRLFAVASEDGTVKLVTISGHFVRTLHHEEPVESVALSADGRHAVTGSWDGQRSLYRLSVWDTTSGTLLRRLGEPAPRRAVVSNDGRHVLSWDAVGTLRLWDATTGRSLRTARPLGGVTAVASSDGDPAVVAQGERLLRVQVLHRAPAAAVMVARPPHSDLLEARHAAFRAAIAHAEDTLATSDVTGALRLLEQAAEVPGYRHHWQVRALGAQLAGRTARSALRGGFAGPSVRDLGGPVQGVSLSPDGERLVTVAFDAATRSIEVQRHDTRRGEPLRVMRLGEQPGPFRAAAVASDRPIVATACGSEVRLWDLEAAGVLGVAGEHRPRALALSADGRYLLLVEDAATTVLDIARVRWLEPFACPAALAVAIADGSDRVVVATASEVALYSLASRRRLRALTGHASPGARVAIEPTATAAAVVHASGRVAFLDPEAGVATVAATVRGATAMALCDDGAAVAIGDAGGGVHIFDAAAEDPVCLGRHRNEVLSVAITPDARLVASGGRDAEVRLWHLEWRRLPPPADGLRRARRWLELYLARREQARSGLPSAGNERGWDPDELAERSRQLGRLGFGAHSPAILEEALDELSAGRRAG